MDVWISLDPLTGEKSEIVSFGDTTCPVAAGSGEKERTLLVGKSEYTVSMVDGPRKWNVTFHDYSSIEMSQQLIQDYGKFYKARYYSAASNEPCFPS